MREPSDSQKADSLRTDTPNRSFSKQDTRPDGPADQAADKASEQPSEPAWRDVADEAGSAVASLWLKVKREDQPPASLPSTRIVLQNCPTCEQSLTAPSQPDYQVCSKCGWSSQPRKSKTSPQADNQPQADIDLQKLLAQAATESLENMKPRKNRQ